MGGKIYFLRAADQSELKRNARRIFQAVDSELKRIWKKNRVWDFEALLFRMKKFTSCRNSVNLGIVLISMKLASTKALVKKIL